MSDRWNKYAGKHMIELAISNAYKLAFTCRSCGHITQQRDKYCGQCGHFVEDEKLESINALTDMLRARYVEPEKWENTDLPVVLLTDEEKKEKESFVFPSTGIYIYFHPHEGYKIGKAENVMRRMDKHLCSAPSSELLHVIETSDLDWCERFLHGKFRHRRIHNNHEYFALDSDDLDWLFSIKVLDPPRAINDQLSLLDLL